MTRGESNISPMAISCAIRAACERDPAFFNTPRGLLLLASVCKGDGDLYTAVLGAIYDYGLHTDNGVPLLLGPGEVINRTVARLEG